VVRELTRLLAWFHHAPGQPRLAGRRQATWRQVLPVAAVGFAVAALIVGVRAGLPGEFDVNQLFWIGSDWGMVEAIVARGGSVQAVTTIGYDGQWFLGLAYDPLVQGEIVANLDRPQYRAQRPLFPMAGWLAAAGQPGAIPYGLLAVSLLVIALGCAACARIVTGYGRSRWWGLLFVAIPGVVVALAYGTAEPMGLALAALGLSLVIERRYTWAGVVFAGAALTKETYLAFAFVAAAYLAVDAWVRKAPTRRWIRDAAVLTVPGTVLLAGWWWYVSTVVPDSQRTPNHLLDMPFMGWWRVSRNIVRGEYPPPTFGGTSQIVLAITFVLVVWALVEALRRRQSVLAYGAILWTGFSLCLVDIMLEKTLSSQRVLAPAVLALALFLVAAWPAWPIETIQAIRTQRRAGQRSGTGHSPPPAPPAKEHPSPATSPGAGPA
jgi:hypothetical protein